MKNDFREKLFKPIFHLKQYLDLFFLRIIIKKQILPKGLKILKVIFHKEVVTN